MKKIKGFTLIELLATVAVLAIVALIAIPLVSGVTERIEKKSFKQSAIGLLKTTGLERNNGISVYEKYIIGNSSIKINKNGQIVTVNNDGKITGNGYVVYLETGESFINYTNGKWCATKDFDEQEVKVIKGDCTDIDLFTCSKPKISKNVGNEIWTQYKIVSVSNNANRNCKIQYSINNGEYEEYKGPIKLTNEANIKVQAVNVEDEAVEEEETITKIDSTAPINVVARRGAVTSNSITVIADGRDNESGIYGYLFSINGGEWVSSNEDNSPQTNNVYVFTGLTHDTNYNIKVKVYNHTYGSEGWEEEKGATESTETSITTTKIEAPTYNVPNGWTNTSKTVTIDYKDSDNLYVHEYSKDGGEWTPYPSTGVTFAENGTIVARVRDGASNDPKTNIVSASSQTVSGIDKTAPTIVLQSNSDTTYTKTKSVTVTLQDAGGSGIKASTNGIKYGWSTSNKTAPTTWTNANVVATTGTNTTIFTATGSGVTGSYYLWVQPADYQDKAGNKNTTAVVSTGTFKYDNTAPTVTYNVEGGTYNTTKTVTVTGNDNTGGSGLSKMTVHVYKATAGDYDSNKFRPAKSYNDTTSSSVNVVLDEDGPWTIYTAVYDAAGNKQCQQPDNAGENCSGFYYQTYVIDTTTPTVTYAFMDGTAATHNGTYNANKIMRVTGNDNTGGSGFNYMNVHLYNGVAGDYSHPVSLTNGITSRTYDITLTEGTWTIYTAVYDAAGNKQCQQPDNAGENCSGWYYQTYTMSLPAYYAFGMPDTSSTTDYKTLNKNVFIRLKNGQYSVCLYSAVDNFFDCFNPNMNSERPHFSSAMDSYYDASSGKSVYKIHGTKTFNGNPSKEYQCAIRSNKVTCATSLGESQKQYVTGLGETRTITYGAYEVCEVTKDGFVGCYLHNQFQGSCNYLCFNVCAPSACSNCYTNYAVPCRYSVDLDKCKVAEMAKIYDFEGALEASGAPWWEYTTTYCRDQCNSATTRSAMCSKIGATTTTCATDANMCYSSCYAYMAENNCVDADVFRFDNM